MANTVYGGFEGGTDAIAQKGGAIGLRAETVDGGAVGKDAYAQDTGFAGGSGAIADSSGAAVGENARCQGRGFAGGEGSSAGYGVAIGLNAKVSNTTNAIQLGEGTNTESQTLQVYGYQLLDGDGKIPTDRMPDTVLSGLSTNDFTNEDKAKLDLIKMKSYTGGEGIFIGESAGINSYPEGIAIGKGTRVISNGVAIGEKASAAKGAAVGYLAKSDAGFSGGYMARTDLDAIQLGTGTNQNEKSLQVYDYQLLDADGHIPGDRLNAPKDNSAYGQSNSSWVQVAPMQNEYGGFDGGFMGHVGGAKTGAALGYVAMAQDGGAIGKSAHATSGGAVGESACAYSGGAIGHLAYANKGFGGGDNAVAQAEDCIQLGTGTNNQEGTFQVYDYKLLDADGHIPSARLDAPQTGFAYGQCNGEWIQVAKQSILDKNVASLQANINKKANLDYVTALENRIAALEAK